MRSFEDAAINFEWEIEEEGRCRYWPQMNEPVINRSNNVFKKFIRSRVRDSVDEPGTEKSRPSSHKVYLKNIETGDPHAKQGRCGPFHWFVVWDNNFSLKLLGSKNAIEKEEERRLSLNYFIIHPCCRFK